jgi:hypothetical protein
MTEDGSTIRSSSKGLILFVFSKAMSAWRPAHGQIGG